MQQRPHHLPQPLFLRRFGLPGADPPDARRQLDAVLSSSSSSSSLAIEHAAVARERVGRPERLPDPSAPAAKVRRRRDDCGGRLPSSPPGPLGRAAQQGSFPSRERQQDRGDAFEEREVDNGESRRRRRRRRRERGPRTRVVCSNPCPRRGPAIERRLGARSGAEEQQERRSPGPPLATTFITAAAISSIESPRQNLSESSSGRGRARAPTPLRRSGGGDDDVEVERRQKKRRLLRHGPRREGLARRLRALEVVEVADGEVGPQGRFALGGQLLVEELFFFFGGGGGGKWKK